jgi:hypothetical protein
MDSLNDEKEADIAPAHKKAARKDASKQFAQSRVDFLKIEKKHVHNFPEYKSPSARRGTNEHKEALWMRLFDESYVRGKDPYSEIGNFLTSYVKY